MKVPSINRLKLMIVCFRNNSARELSAFAESAMAVNRVVLQHMSLNLLEDFPGYNADGTLPEQREEDEEYDEVDDVHQHFYVIRKLWLGMHSG